MKRASRCLALGLVALASLTPLASLSSAAAPASPSAIATPEPVHVPVLAYYYIWFTPSSWDRAKTDYPALGRYSSDDPDVMRQHIAWAKAAGIDGFIVSWKNTPTLTQRLTQLVQIADQEQFKLVVIYQGLDVKRNPQPAERVAADLDYFADTFADDQAFDLFGRPVVIWSGTWEFTRDQIAQVTETRRARLLILASERNAADYLKVADLVDGDAYYWSSVNPATYPSYDQKLRGMADVIHQQGGLWIAPAAPGFDARLIGGTRIIERQAGATMRREFAAAAQSSPDAIGLISWNEFSENSHIEPSCLHGSATLAVVASLLGGSAPANVGCAQAERAVTPSAPTPVASVTSAAPVDDTERQQLAKFGFDSSSGGSSNLRSGNLALLGGFGVFVIGSITVIARRSRRDARDDSSS